ncbi:ExbD/TolR family protein [Solimicrobium silvestre]|uniref:Biopolymer transport protein n=1 Tax=Solimicrobium silvestre TaxID=2099400 RepID=A0A2S9H5M6_9BURK|nr:ExbD/TolR family protein [Solimicrobium silvestre]PRC95277.1 Biopolymer transport protein [Solimicrobium silvestre]
MPVSMRSGRTRKLKSEINVVPYIDVMLVLVVILMVAAPMTNPSVVNLPNAGASKQAPTDYLELTIKPDGTASVGKHSQGKAEASTGRADLLERLQHLHETEPDLPLLIAADKEIKYDEVIQMIAGAKKLGISRVGLATK